MPNIGPLDFVLLLVSVAVVVVPIVLVAQYANRKGYSYAVFALLGLFLTWPIALLAAIVMPRRAPQGA